MMVDREYFVWANWVRPISKLFCTTECTAHKPNILLFALKIQKEDGPYLKQNIFGIPLGLIIIKCKL